VTSENKVQAPDSRMRVTLVCCYWCLVLCVYFKVVQACIICGLFGRWTAIWLGSCLWSTSWHVLRQSPYKWDTCSIIAWFLL